ncbi:MAG: glutamate--tRNA ligase [Epsilonproteobacteria bacterium]|nr:glutamate--tRNA ligase [Campylobacterota bacterium]
MKHQKVRVRFAPSPTGFMHIGNIRAALMNYLFARQKNGTTIIRIEDTDQARNIKDAEQKIFDDLFWLGLRFDETPKKPGEFGPYRQSDRKELYQTHLNELINTNKVYPCFCTPEQLEQQRTVQLAAGKPPRYARTCMGMAQSRVELKQTAGTPFIWRFKLNDLQVITINDLARGSIDFELKHFSDFALTRQDGSFTFLFTNFIDDWLMNISHVVRGEDHLSNTALQAALYHAFAVQLPVFWHLPIICNISGEKLSKRDFGFSLDDVKSAGFLPEAICNYMAIVGASFEQEIQSVSELITNFDFDNIHATGTIKYDLDKLTWVNHKWINKISVPELAKHVTPVLTAAYGQNAMPTANKLEQLLEIVRGEMNTLLDAKALLACYFTDPTVEKTALLEWLGSEKYTTILTIISNQADNIKNTDHFLDELKTQAKQQGLKIKDVFGSVRYLLTGNFQGVGMHDLFAMLETEKIKQRLEAINNLKLDQ